MNQLHFNSKYTDEELLVIMKEYAEKVKFPTVRDFKPSNNLPSSTTYIERFGSFQDAILKAGIDIPENKLRYFNREQLDDATLLEKLKSEVLKKGSLLTAKEIVKNKNLPTDAVYHKRFGSLTKTYEILGFENLNNDKIKKELEQKYMEIFNKINRTPTSRDLDEFSKKGNCPSSSTFIHYFGGIDNLQKLCNLSPTKPARNKSKKEMIEDLKIVASELGRTPTQTDIINFPFIASASSYNIKFGSFVKALEKAGFESNKHKVYYTKLGTPCYSRMEHLFAQMLEKYNIEYKKDIKYSDLIKSVKRKITCDFVIILDNKKYLVEIFGIQGNDGYEENKNYKIKLCEENNIPLIQFNFDDFWNKRQVDIYSKLMSLISIV